MNARRTSDPLVARWCLAALATGAGLPLHPVSAQIPEGYEVVMLANDPGIHSAPEINDRSEVAWSSAYPPPIDESDVWLFSEGVIRKISDDEGYDVQPSINNGSVVAWMRCPSYFNSGCDLAMWHEGAITAVETPFLVQDAPKIGEANQIVWAHDFSGDAGHIELFRTVGGGTEQLTSSGLSNQGARMNSAGDIVWTEYDFSVNPWRSRIMRLFVDHEAPVPLTDFTGEPQAVDINDARQIVWQCAWGCEQLGIHLWEDGNITIVTENGRVPRINDRGQILLARFDWPTENWATWLYTDGEFLQLSDLVYSSGAHALNSAGEVAWRGILNDYGDMRTFLMRRVGSAGDMDGDGDVDWHDLRAFQTCVGPVPTGPAGSPGYCTRGDFDHDADVDLEDFAAFQESFSGPDVPVP